MGKCSVPVQILISRPYFPVLTLAPRTYHMDPVQILISPSRPNDYHAEAFPPLFFDPVPYKRAFGIQLL